MLAFFPEIFTCNSLQCFQLSSMSLLQLPGKITGWLPAYITKILLKRVKQANKLCKAFNSIKLKYILDTSKISYHLRPSGHDVRHTPILNLT